jgi:hypothetical protein
MESKKVRNQKKKYDYGCLAVIIGLVAFYAVMIYLLIKY